MVVRSKKDPAPHVGIPLGDHVEEYLVPPQFDGDGVQVSSAIGRDGREYPDPVPMSPPVGYVQPHDLMWMIKHMIEAGRDVLSAADVETEEEANDFEIDDDPVDPLTPYEKVFLPDAPTVNSAAPAGAGAAASSVSTPSASPDPGKIPAGPSGTSGTPPGGAPPSSAGSSPQAQ